MNLPKELTTVTLLSKYLAMLVFIILPIVGFFLGIRYQEMTDLVQGHLMEENLSITRIPTPTPVAIPTIDSSLIAGWQTYHNEEYGFEVRYPIQAFVKEVLDPASYFDRTSFLVLYIDTTLEQTANLPTASPEGYISFFVDDDPIWIEHCLESDVASKKSPDKIARIDGVEFFVFDESDAAAGGARRSSKSYRAVHNNKCHRIESSVTWRDVTFYRGATTGDSTTEEEISEQKELVERQVDYNTQILSTFRFVETADIKDKEPVGMNEINLQVVEEVVPLGGTITVTWDSSGISSNAGITMHVVRPDRNFVSGTGVAGLDPRLERYELTLPSEFYGFVENGDYYISAVVTRSKDPNDDLGAIFVKSESFKITSNK